MNVKIIENFSPDSSVNFALDTIKIGKQAIIFVNSKRSAESLATKIYKEVKRLSLIDKEPRSELSSKIMNALENPTEQCKKLASLALFGVSFHHSGLLSSQRSDIENGFKAGLIKIIVATPTLAAGVNLPAFRILIKDLYRYDGYMKKIPVLEFHQMTGRAGRPGYETYGEAVALSSSEGGVDEIFNSYIYGKIENITSKLGVRSILSSSLLGLCTRMNSVDDIMNFMKDTFYAYQFGDMGAFRDNVVFELKHLEELKFIRIESGSSFDSGFFKVAGESENMILSITELGRRVAELYLNPVTGAKLISFISRNKKDAFAFFYEIADMSELRPMFNVGTKESEKYVDVLLNHGLYYDSDSIKKAKFARIFDDWMNEMSEGYILENYNIRPGELRSKIDLLDWIIFSATELSKVVNPQMLQWFSEMRYRVKFGVKRELLPLIQLKYVGRVRSRLLYNSGIMTVKDLVDKKSLARKLLGKNYDRILKYNDLEKKKNYEFGNKKDN